MNKKPLFLLAIATAMLASCSDPQPRISSGELSSGLVVSSYSSEAMTEVDDVDITTGEYMANNTIYAFDKAAKKVTVTRYPTYSSYKDKTGEKLLETPVKYVTYDGSALAHYQKINAITFEDRTTIYYIFPLDGAIRLDSYSTDSPVRMVISLSLTTVGDIIEPTYGHYVSTEQKQYKVDAQGQRIETSDGGYLRETFFIHLELEEKSAKLFASQTQDSHGDNPIHQLEDYELLFVSGKLGFHIPHVGGKYKADILIVSATEIHIVNSYEKDGDYSMSGIMTKVGA